MSNFHHHQEAVDGEGRRAVQTVDRRRFSPGQLLGGLTGAFLLLVGIVAVTRCGIDGSLEQPTTQIFGVTHSSIVGIVEIVAGLLLILGAAGYQYKATTGAVGALLLMAGVLLAASSADILADVGAGRSTGWFLVIAGAVALGASLMPAVVRSETTVDGPGPAAGTGTTTSTH